MSLKQLSIFVENKPGRLAETTRILHENNIDIRALSIADTTDFGILRLIVNDAPKAEKVLKSAHFTVSLTDVIGVSLEDKPGGLAYAVNVLEGIGIEYMYAFTSREEGSAYVILRVENIDKAVNQLNEKGIKVLDEKDICMF